MSNKYSSPHDRALIAFASCVLEQLDLEPDWSADTAEEICSAAHNFGLATTDKEAMFRVIPRERFRNPLEL